MKKMGVLLVVVAALAGCGGSSSDEPAAADVEFTWEKGPAPGTGSNVWVLAPRATDDEIDAICADFQNEWPDEAAGEDQITVANDTSDDTSSLVCAHVEY